MTLPYNKETEKQIKEMLKENVNEILKHFSKFLMKKYSDKQITPEIIEDEINHFIELLFGNKDKDLEYPTTNYELAYKEKLTLNDYLDNKLKEKERK